MTGVKIRPAPVRKSIVVNAPVEKAFAVFTRQFGTWWPASHSIGASPLKTVVIEPRQGGRWYEVGEDGSHCPWGDVLAWNEPHGLVLAWRIGADWKFDPELLTEVEVRFSPEGENRTRVDLEHRLLENMGDAADGARTAYDSPGGWQGMLALYGGMFG